MRYQRTHRQMKRTRALLLQHRNCESAQTYTFSAKLVEVTDRVNYHDDFLKRMTDTVNANTDTLRGISQSVIDHIG